MATIKILQVEVTYTVNLCDVEIPQNIYEQLRDAANDSDGIDQSGLIEYPGAARWLTDNISEGDSVDWVAKVDTLS
jgi:hypothetical protein